MTTPTTIDALRLDRSQADGGGLASPAPPSATPRWTSRRIALAVLVVACVALRVAEWPLPYVYRDADEETYLENGLNAWEGMTPGTKFTPGGSTTWISWTYAAALSAKHLVAPGSRERAAGPILRPLVAVEHALFDAYADLVPLQRITLLILLLASIWGVAAGFTLGCHRAGVAGGCLVGGLMAVLPLFVESAGMAKPYVIGWSFGVVALQTAATRSGVARWLGAGLALGVAIGSRVEMVTLLPLMILEFWETRSEARPWRGAGLAVMTAAGSAVLVAPWLLLNVLGNLRTIVIVRFLDTTVAVSIRQGIDAVGLGQGLGPLVILVIPSLLLAMGERRVARWIAVVFTVIVLATILHKTGFGLRHHGASLVVVVVGSAMALQGYQRRWPRVVPIVCALCLALPIVRGVVSIVERKAAHVEDHATAWVETHVPAGTIVYLTPTLRDPLPTRDAGDRIWREVADPDAWMRKVESAAKRIGVSTADLPRVLSEENMISDRGHFRRWFILGGPSEVPRPRYDVRLYAASGYFGLQEETLAAAFKDTGGVVIWRGRPRPDLGAPVITWVNARGSGAYVFCSDEIRRRLRS